MQQTYIKVAGKLTRQVLLNGARVIPKPLFLEQRFVNCKAHLHHKARAKMESKP